jgi:hypothetical protein
MWIRNMAKSYLSITYFLFCFRCLQDRNPAMELPAGPICACGSALQTVFKQEAVTPVGSPAPMEVMDWNMDILDGPMLGGVDALMPGGGGELEPVQVPFEFPSLDEIIRFLENIDQELHANWN